MTDLESSEAWRNEIAEVRAALNKRFSQLKCLRCGEQKFMLRLWPDEALSPGLSDNRVAELICENCGFQEKHVVAHLKKDTVEEV